MVRGNRRSGTPRSQAGHTATVCGRKMLVIGGLQNKTYLSECFALDTDHPRADADCALLRGGAATRWGSTWIRRSFPT